MLKQVAALALVISVPTVSLGSEAGSRSRITFKAYGEKTLCSSLIVNEAKEMAANPKYQRDRDLISLLSPSPPLGAEIIATSNVEQAFKDEPTLLGSSADWPNFLVLASQFDLLNRGDVENIYDLKGLFNYVLGGDVFVVTDLAVPEKEVAAALEPFGRGERDLSELTHIVETRGWHVFSGKETPYQSLEHVTINAFQYKSQAYLAMSGVEGPLALVVKPNSHGSVSTECVFPSMRRAHRFERRP